MNTPHRARKRFGQNFLTNTGVLTQLTDCISPKPDDNLVEIGPGKGALTEYLLAKTPHLNAIEIDRDLIPLLKNKFESSQLTIHQADALIFSFKTLSKKPHDLRVVGNLPYNISTPLLFKLFEQIDCIDDMHFMLQKEVVQRLTAPVHDSHYGRLSVMTQYYCDTEYLFTVPPEAFDPQPKVDSAIVRLTPKKITYPANNMLQFSNIVKEAFTYRRKTLSNCLKKVISADKLIEIDIDPKTRPQSLTVDEFVRISNAISLE